MNSLRIIWDVLFRGEKVVKKGVKLAVAGAMDDYSRDHKKESVLVWTTLLDEQKTSRAGFTSGLRYLIPVDHLSSVEIKELADSLIDFENENCESSNCMISESLKFPLGRQEKSRFPILGKIALTCNFTDGIGYTELKKIRNVKNNQAKDTKNGLDPLRTGSGSSGDLFSKEFRNIMSDSLWFLIFSTMTAEGYNPPSEVLNRGSNGGMYQLSFDLRSSISELVSISKDVWWSPLNKNDINMNPQLIFNPEKTLDNALDPINYHHHDKKNNFRIKNVLETELQQSGDGEAVEDLKYILNRLTKHKRIQRQLTGETHGLVPGLEEALIGKHIIQPWLTEEFFNCLAFFLMTRKPKYWRNGESEIQLLHLLEELDIESLKNY